MRKLKNLFATPKKAVIASVCAVAILLTIGTGTVYAAGAIAESSAIGAENAQNFAFADAGVDPAAATIQRTEFDSEMGQFVYEVEFEANSTQYEYWIKASNGTVLKKEVEIIAPATSVDPPAQEITLEQAKEIALADAGLKADQVTFTEARLDADDGNRVYEIDFYAENAEYEYEINAATGNIYSRSKETVILQTQPSTESEAAVEKPKPETDKTPTETTGYIGLSKAKEKALADAGVNASDVTYTKAKLEKDDGVMSYDIEFYTDTHEYEYEIHATTGAVREKSVEKFKTGNTGSANNAGNANDSNHSNSSGNYIGLDKAKSIAVNRAGLSMSQVTFRKAKLEKDDGVMVYDIEFVCDGMEYECEINASTGKIREYDCERDD